ncbi:MAG: hypothetical protein JSV19_08560 [Phycisphaerales bacterium]|nr:MAG: hypothetical protein JSV19_08560 [Phycisphaerales bacterium]
MDDLRVFPNTLPKVRGLDVACFQWLTGRPFGEVLYMADTRDDAPRWDQEYYGIGAPRWKTKHGNR